MKSDKKPDPPKLESKRFTPPELTLEDKRRMVIFELLTTKGREIILQDYRIDSCAASTKITIDILRRFGWVANELPTRVMVFNKHLRDRIATKTFDGKMLPADWSVGIGYSEGPKKPKHYNGHLVCICEGWLIDMSLDQACRPAKNIDVYPVYFRPPPLKEWPFEFELNGCFISYDTHTDRSYMEGRDWQDTARMMPTVVKIMDMLIKETARLREEKE